MAISQLIKKEFGNAKDVSGIGGVETGNDAAEFLLLGANSVQVCPFLIVVSGPHQPWLLSRAIPGHSCLSALEGGPCSANGPDCAAHR